MRWLWLLLALVGVAMLAHGISAGQIDGVIRHAKALCTACIGLG
jgi:hypothetical protein